MQSKSYLAYSKSLALVLLPQVFFDPLWVQVLCGMGLKLKAERLKILEAILKKDFVSCFHFLKTVLGIFSRLTPLEYQVSP